MEVKFFDYPLVFKTHEKEYTEIVLAALSKGAYLLGEETERFEENLARFVGSRYAVGVGNCTDALLLSLIAADVRPGDEVISVSHTFVATIEVIHFLGGRPVFVDIADDHNMDVGLVEAAITEKTRAIVPVQLNGRVCSGMDGLVDLARGRNIIIIEDSAQALGGKYGGKGAGTFGLTGNFSFYPAKLLGAFGDAGAVVTDDEHIARKIKMLRHHGRFDGTDINAWGLNCRMDNLQAAVLDFKLTLLPGWIKRRRELASLYDIGLGGVKEIKLPPPPAEDGVHYDVFQNYEIECENRDLLRSHLEKRGVGTILPWGGKGVHQFAPLGLGRVVLPRTEDFFRKCLMLPMYPELTDEQLRHVVESIKEFYLK